MRLSLILLTLCSSLWLCAQDSAHPRSITYRTKTLIANSVVVHTKADDSLIVVFNDGKIFSMSSLRPELTHITDTRKKVRYSTVANKQIFKLEKVNPDTTSYIYTYVKLPDTAMIGKYVGYRHRFTMRDKFTGTTYTVVLYECPDIKVDAEYSRYIFSELFFMKVPIRLEGAVIKALAEERIDNKPVSRDELILTGLDAEANWPVNFETPIEKNFTMMLPESGRKDKEYAKELLQDVSGRTDYPTIPYRQEFDHN